MHNLSLQICYAFRYLASSSQSCSPLCAVLPATIASFTVLAPFASVAFGPRPVSHHGSPVGASVAFGSTSIVVHRSWFPLGASVVVGPASLAVHVGRSPFNLVVTMSSWPYIVGHCFILTHDLHEPLCSVYQMLVLVSVFS